MKKAKNYSFRNLILILSIIICIIIAVFAWFANVPATQADGISVAAYKTIGLEAAFNDVEEEYTSKLTDNTLKSFPLITGDGSDFFIPKLDKATGEPMQSSTAWVVKKDAVANEDYYEKDIYFRSTEEVGVYLNSSSSVTPKDKVGNQSDYGNFSKDYIAGAARVAFYKVTGSGDEEILTPRFIWVPNSGYQLEDGSDFSFKYSTITTGSTVIITGTDDSTCALAFDDDLALTSVRLKANNNAIDFKTVPYNCMFLLEKSGTSVSFKHLRTGMYLSHDSSVPELSSSKVSYSYSSDKNGYSFLNGKYLSLNGTNFVMSGSSSKVKLYYGKPYRFYSDGVPEHYYYYLKRNTLNEVLVSDNNVCYTWPPSDYVVATLTKSDSDKYYKAHIKIRVWAEGTDREAQLPLADGTFNCNFVFEAKTFEY